MTETMKNILQRYSCRDFTDTPVTDEQIKTLVDAALAAPSAQNLQPWHVTVVTDKSFINEMDAAGMDVMRAMEDQMYYERIMGRGGKLFYNAPCMIVISAGGSPYATLDAGIQCQNIVLAAESMGLGSCIVGLMSIPLGGEKGEDFKKRLQFPEGMNFAIAILVGTIGSGKPPHDFDTSKVSYVK